MKSVITPLSTPSAAVQCGPMRLQGPPAKSKFLAATKTLLLFICLIFILSSCSSYDRTILTEFEPLSGKRFKYTSRSDLTYPEDSERAEKMRMEWLEKYLTDNNLCAGGYVIEERKVVVVLKALIGPGKIKDIYYYGRCK